MLQRCSSNNTPLSILFPMSSSSGGNGMDDGAAIASYYSSSSVVDCTLSLGTPSTRHTHTTTTTTTPSIPSPYCTQQQPQQRSTFCWDHLITHSPQYSSNKPTPTTTTTTTQPTNSPPTSCNLGGDPLLLARRCANCDTTCTPLWRNGPRGPKSLCNACGIRYKKEERRAAASSTSTAPTTTTVNGNETTLSYSNYRSPPQQQYTWGGKSTTTSSWIQNDHLHHDNNSNVVVDHIDVPNYGLSWRLSVVPPQFQVADRTSPLFHFH